MANDMYVRSICLPTTHRVIIKTAPPGEVKDCYEREVENYEIDSIASSPYIRKLVDLIGHDKDGNDIKSRSQPQCMVLEWMDSDLWQLRPSDRYRSGSKLPMIIAKSVLEALVVIDDLGGIHTGMANSQ